MNNKVNYILIGILVIIGIIGIGMFGFWLLKPTKESEVQRYIVYFNESVLGLNLDAPVKYKGLSVGKVVKLSISQNHSDQVEVLIEVLNETPIKTSTVAQLTSQGITGLSYINLTFNEDEDQNAQALVAKNSDKYPIIKSVPSLLIKLENRFIDISDGLIITLEKIQELLKKENQDDLSKLLKNSNNLIGNINALLDENTINNFKQSMNNLNRASKKLDETIPKLTKLIEKSDKWEDEIVLSFKSIKDSYLGIEDSMTTFKTSLQNGDFNIKEITNDLVYNINQTLLEIQLLTNKSNEAINKYERSPADMIFKKEQIKKGPGER